MSNNTVRAVKIILFFIFVIMAGVFYLARWHKQALAPQTLAVHYSYFSQPDFFDQAYRDVNSPRPPLWKRGGEQPKAIMVNHHLLAGNFIAEAFNAVATDGPLTVLLVSPNHFDAGKADIIISGGNWQTPYGMLSANQQLSNQLAKAGLASIEEAPFVQEHGVSGIVAFIKKSLPNATVVPVIFRNRMTLGQALSSADKFHQVLDADKSARYMIVGSFDFSHYLPSQAADFHDLENLADVESFNFSALYNLDIDSRPGLAFFLELLKDQGDQKFSLLEHSNSAKLTHQDALETTSYITGYFSAGSPSSATAATLLSVPSIIPSSQTTSEINFRDKAYALTYLERLFYGQDITDVFLQKSDNQIQTQLARLKITPVFGDKIVEKLGGLKVVLLDCTKGGNGKNGGKGEVDEGADAVVCQGADQNRIELYKNKPIIYAAGNLLDQNTISEAKQSLAVGLAYQGNQLKIYLFPIGVDGKELKLLIGKQSGTVLADMANLSEVPEKVKQEIKSGIITINN